MNILTIDTSTDIELIALSVNGKIFQYCDYAGQSHSVTMFDNISSLLSQASITINDLDLIGTGIGPGSFTGIRISVSTARMFAQILKIPLVGIKSQEIYAASVSCPGGKTVLAAFDAKKSRVFAGIYNFKNVQSVETQCIASLQLIEETISTLPYKQSMPCLYSTLIDPGDYYMEEILESAKNHESIKDLKELICIGDGCEKYIEVIDNFSKQNGFIYTFIDKFLPDGKAACELTLRKYNESPERYIDFENTVPFYARKSDAESIKYGK